MRKNVTNFDYAGDVQTKRFQLPANSADKDMDALAVERLTGTPGKAPKLFARHNPINVGYQER